jgi:hypothetical protein
VPATGDVETTGRVRVVREFRIDGYAADLVPIRRITVGTDGRIAFSQVQDHSIRFFSAGGADLAAFGRRGRGPAEFQDINQLNWLADTLWAWDARLSRVTLIAPDRALIRTIIVPGELRSPGASTEATFEGLAPIGMYADGSFLAYTSTPDFDALVRVTHDGTLMRVLARLSTIADVNRIVTASGHMADGNPFPSLPLHAVSPDGRLIAIVRTSMATAEQRTFAVTVMNLDSDTLFARTYPFEGVPIPQHIADSVVAMAAARMPPELAAAFKREAYIPPVYPPITRVLVSSHGIVWVELRDTGDGPAYLVLNDAGDPIGTVRFQPNVVAAALDRDAVWCLEADENGVQSIVRYRIEKT